MADIRIENLFKIFGPHGARYVEAVKGGMSKTELNERHGHVLGLKDISLTVKAGRIQVVMGLSGSGKSTLIRHINRLIEPTAGRIIYQGQDVCAMAPAELQDFRRHKTAMVFQKFALLPHRRVIDNAAYGLMVQGMAKKEARKAAEKWIARVGLEGFEDRYPNQLSGGMQQRVGLARALTNDADILLMDEAFSALDPLIRIDMQSVLLDLQQELGKTMVFITHDLDEAIRLGDNIAILRDGSVIQEGTGQEIVLNPADDYIRNFVKDVSRGQVLTAGAVMSRGPAELGEAIVIGEGTYIEQAVKSLVDARQSDARVVNAAGDEVGHLDLHAAVAAMVTPN
jgi:glycine betaine/proline transport system ATP-binding protein